MLEKFPNKPEFNEHKTALNIIECDLCHSDSYEVRFSNCARQMEHWEKDYKKHSITGLSTASRLFKYCYIAPTLKRP